MSAATLAIGTVLKPHGLHGEMRVAPLSSFPERFHALKEVLLRLGDRCETFAVEGARPHKEFILIKLKGIERVEEAEEWRNADLEIPSDQAWPHGPDFHFYHSLTGLPAHLPRGERLGTVAGFDEGPGGVNVIITNEAGREYAVPFVKEFITVVPGDKIIVRPIPGLLSEQEEG